MDVACGLRCRSALVHSTPIPALAPVAPFRRPWQPSRLYARMAQPKSATYLVQRLTTGDPAAAQELFTLVYGELKQTAQQLLAGERRGHTLQATALVHEAFLRLCDADVVGYQGRDHFLRTAVTAMRHVLTDHARARRAEKRAGGRERVPLDDVVEEFERRALDLLSLDEALKELSQIDEELGRIVELRYFGGFTIDDTARILEISTPTVERRWRLARSWLHDRLKGK